MLDVIPMTRQLFLPLGLLAAVFSGFYLPTAGIFISENSGSKLLVFIIFLVSGYQTGKKGLALNKNLFSLFLLAAIISLFIAPLMGLFFSQLFNFPLHLATGLIIICTVPPTISSGVVITEVSRGNAVLALFLTISLNLLGILTMPFMLDFSLNAAGPIDIDQTGLLIKMIFFVLLPFGIGKIIRNISAKSHISPYWNYVNSSCVILVVYASMATSGNAFSDLEFMDYLLILAGVSLVHILLLLMNYQTGKFLQLSTADNKALVFVASQKTLAICLAVLANIQFDTGPAIIVCLMFHFFQLLMDSFLAAYLQKR